MSTASGLFAFSAVKTRCQKKKRGVRKKKQKMKETDCVVVFELNSLYSSKCFGNTLLRWFALDILLTTSNFACQLTLIRVLVDMH